MLKSQKVHCCWFCFVRTIRWYWSAHLCAIPFNRVGIINYKITQHDFKCRVALFNWNINISNEIDFWMFDMEPTGSNSYSTHSDSFKIEFRTKKTNQMHWSSSDLMKQSKILSPFAPSHPHQKHCCLFYLSFCLWQKRKHKCHNNIVCVEHWALSHTTFDMRHLTMWKLFMMENGSYKKEIAFSIHHSLGTRYEGYEAITTTK